MRLAHSRRTVGPKQPEQRITKRELDNVSEAEPCCRRSPIVPGQRPSTATFWRLYGRGCARQRWYLAWPIALTEPSGELKGSVPPGCMAKNPVASRWLPLRGPRQTADVCALTLATTHRSTSSAQLKVSRVHGVAADRPKSGHVNRAVGQHQSGVRCDSHQHHPHAVAAGLADLPRFTRQGLCI